MKKIINYNFTFILNHINKFHPIILHRNYRLLSIANKVSHQSPVCFPRTANVSLRTGLLEDSLMRKMLGFLLDCLSVSHLVQTQEQGLNIGKYSSLTILVQA